MGDCSYKNRSQHQRTHSLSLHFRSPYVNYLIVRPSYNLANGKDMQNLNHILSRPILGIASAKMMHDFGVSKTHTIIMNLPLFFDPLNLAAYDSTSRSRFGVFPRYQPQDIRWFETNPCCIFHTANSWNTIIREGSPDYGSESVNMLCCRLTSAALVFSAGHLLAPQPVHNIPAGEEEEEPCRLYCYQFELSNNTSENIISNQWALAAIPFEFPTLRDAVSMSAAKYIYGYSVSGTSFVAALGRAVKIIKMDIETLTAKGKRDPLTLIRGCVEKRDIDTTTASHDPDDPIKVFMMPKGWYTQEARFVPHSSGTSEGDGWLLAYIFDESSQLGADGEPKTDAKSELWIIDAKNMTDVVAKILLPQRVPYGLHGNWI